MGKSASVVFAAFLINLVLTIAAPAQDSLQGEARGLVRSLGEATISSELSARITEMPFREGEMFSAGEVLVAFDCVGLRANLAGAVADLRVAKTALDAAREMVKFKATGLRDVEQAEAHHDRARADVDAMHARINGCEVRAPFSGVVVDRNAHPHEVISPSTPLLRIVDMTHLEIELLVSSSALKDLTRATPFVFRVDQTGQTYDAHIVRLGSVVDPASQTVKIFAMFNAASAAVLPGMSGTAIFQSQKPTP